MLALLVLPQALWAVTEQTLLQDGYVSGQMTVLRGRLIQPDVFSPEHADDSSSTNLRRSLARLKQKELKHAPVRLQLGALQVSGRSDNEGRFQLPLLTGELAPGWHAVEAVPPAAPPARLFVPDPANELVLLSDVDDTVLWSEVNHKQRLLQHSLMENSLQRRGFAGTAAFYHQLLQANARPATSTVIYLSASPQQLGPPIRAFLQREQFPEGLLLLKTIARRQGDPWLDQQRYKLRVLHGLLRDLAPQRFILVGDDGEHDPEIYLQLQQRFPERIAAVLIRNVHPDRQRAAYPGQCDLAAAIVQPPSCPALSPLLLRGTPAAASLTGGTMPAAR